MIRKIKGGREAKWLSVIVPAAAVLLIAAGVTFFYKTNDTMDSPSLQQKMKGPLFSYATTFPAP